jgi:conjugal transfer pilus assembly protein TraB
LNPNGNTGQLSPEFGDIMKSAGAEGAGTALNKVADFYLKMAEKVFPIIEISAGRKVDILILEQSKMNYGNKVKSGG